MSDRNIGSEYLYGGSLDPRVDAYMAPKGSLYILVSKNNVNPIALLQKQDYGKTTNWTEIGGSGVILASNVVNDSSVVGSSVKDALNTLLINSPYKNLWTNVNPLNGYLLPVAAVDAYYPTVLYSSTPIFNDGSNLYNYVCYFGGRGSPFRSCVSYSNDGMTWTTEVDLVGGIGNRYHSVALLIGTTIHLFYWNTTVSIYSAGAIRHATINAAADCKVVVSDNPLTGTYISGPSGGGNLRAGTYGAAQLFYNPSPTSNPANPYTYPWCMVHNGTDGNREGLLFATSPDGLNFSAWNGLTEVIPRGASPAWDQWTGNFTSIIDDKGLWHAYYSGGLGTSAGEDTNFGGGFGYATSLDGITWTKWDFNPLLRKTNSFKSWKRLYCTWLLRESDGYYLYFTCKDNPGVYVTSKAKINGFI